MGSQWTRAHNSPTGNSRSQLVATVVKIHLFIEWIREAKALEAIYRTRVVGPILLRTVLAREQSELRLRNREGVVVGMRQREMGGRPTGSKWLYNSQIIVRVIVNTARAVYVYKKTTREPLLTLTSAVRGALQQQIVVIALDRCGRQSRAEQVLKAAVAQSNKTSLCCSCCCSGSFIDFIVRSAF